MPNSISSSSLASAETVVKQPLPRGVFAYTMPKFGTTSLLKLSLPLVVPDPYDFYHTVVNNNLYMHITFVTMDGYSKLDRDDCLLSRKIRLQFSTSVVYPACDRLSCGQQCTR